MRSAFISDSDREFTLVVDFDVVVLQEVKRLTPRQAVNVSRVHALHKDPEGWTLGPPVMEADDALPSLTSDVLTSELKSEIQRVVFGPTGGDSDVDFHVVVGLPPSSSADPRQEHAELLDRLNTILTGWLKDVVGRCHLRPHDGLAYIAYDCARSDHDGSGYWLTWTGKGRDVLCKIIHTVEGPPLH